MKPSHKMKCCTIYVQRDGPEDWAVAIQRTTQKMLDDGWTLRAAVAVGGYAPALPVLIFVRKERVG